VLHTACTEYDHSSPRSFASCDCCRDSAVSDSIVMSTAVASDVRSLMYNMVWQRVCTRNQFFRGAASKEQLLLCCDRTELCAR
jgi:hypothetical protein